MHDEAKTQDVLAVHGFGRPHEGRTCFTCDVNDDEVDDDDDVSYVQ